MNIQQTINFHHKSLVESIARIKHIPEGLLPHIVYIEEESENGVPVYNQYKLIEIHSDESCKLVNTKTTEEEDRQLEEINIDWLVTVWNYYKELVIVESRKELNVFLYKRDKFERNITDTDIIKSWEDNNDAVEKMTPDEFAANINSYMFFDLDYYVRFIRH